MRRNLLSKILPIFFCLNLYFSFAQTTDFIIVENPSALHILNKYEQKISFQEEKLFLTNCALEIINRRETLSDNFSSAVKVKIKNDIFYLLLDQDDQIKNSNGAGYLRIYTKTKLVNDTIEVIKDKTVYLESPDPKSNQKRFLPPGIRLRRIFKSNNKYYCQVMDSESIYGWSTFTVSAGWRLLVASQSSSETIPPEIIGSIQKKITDTNQTLQNLFKYLNAETNENLTIPQWEVEVFLDRIICTFNHHFPPQYFKESTSYLVDKLEYILLGSKLHLVTGQNKITISY